MPGKASGACERRWPFFPARFTAGGQIMGRAHAALLQNFMIGTEQMPVEAIRALISDQEERLPRQQAAGEAANTK